MTVHLNYLLSGWIQSVLVSIGGFTDMMVANIRPRPWSPQDFFANSYLEFSPAIAACKSPFSIYNERCLVRSKATSTTGIMHASVYIRTKDQLGTNGMNV